MSPYGPFATTTYEYWRLGTGNPFSGGSCGYDSTTVDADGITVGHTRTRPAGAVLLTQVEWDTLQAQIVADGTQVVADGDAWLAQQKVDADTLLLSASAKLVAGQPLSPEEAAILTGGL